MAKQMWKIRRAVASDGADPESAQAEVDVGGPTSTGGLLKATREALGLDLRDVAEVLRIRYPYLEAIEGNRFDDLPGSTYAVGFVRTYAEHLGLEGAEVVARFRRETDASKYKPQLVFPAPLVEAKVPGGAVLLIAVFLAVLIYSSWIYVSSQGQTFGSIIPDIQRRIAAITGDGNNDSASTAQTLSIQEPMENIEESNADGSSRVTGELDASASQSAAAVAASTVASDEQLASKSLATPTEEGLESSVDAEDPASNTGSTVTSVVRGSGTSANLEQSTEIAGLPTLPRDIPTASQSQEPVVYGAVNSDSRIAIEALSDSWVEIKNAEEELLLTRVLRTGDSFLVPNRSGLTMMTGNAGALRIIVDGDPVQSIGPRGSVRRDVKLDPELLKNNTAHSL
jgi:cytoskeleton protein RodZ